MTQDEVDLIYDYLHENYEYKDGELIQINKGSNRNGINHKIGSLSMHENKPASLETTIGINKKNYKNPLSHFIYIFHFKLKPIVIKHKDGNPFNNKIENLVNVNHSTEGLSYDKKLKKPNGYSISKYGTYNVGIQVKYDYFHLGTYECENDATNAYIFLDNLIRDKNINPALAIEITRKNHPVYLKNKYGYRGVYKDGNRYRCKFRNKSIPGSFDTPEEAHAAYLKAKEEYGKQ